MKRAAIAVVLGLVSVLVACGGGGGGGVGGGGGGGSTNVVAGFVADNATPGANSVSMAEQSSGGNAVTVAVNMTDTSGVYSAGFDLTFDASKVSFQGWSAGNVLEQGGQSPTYAINQVGSGLLRIGVTRLGNASTVTVSGTQPLIRLNFRVNDLGTFGATLNPGTVADDQLQPLGGISWSDGSFTGS